MNWLQVPRRPAASTRPFLAPVALSAVPLGILIHRLGRPDRWIAVLVVVTLAVVSAARARPRLAPLVAAGGAVALALSFGQAGAVKFTLIWLVSVSLWSVGLGAVRLGSDRLRGGAVLHAALVPLALANVAMVFGSSLAVPAGLCILAMGVGAACAAAPDRAAQLGARLPVARAQAALHRLARWLGTAASALVMVPVALLIAAVWLVHRIVRHDPLAAPTAQPGGWVVRFGPDQAPDHYFGQVAVADDRRPRARRAQLAATTAFLVIVAAVGAAAVGAARSDRWGTSGDARGGRASGEQAGATPLKVTDGVGSVDPARCPETDPDPVMDGQPQRRTLLCETEAVTRRAEFSGPATYRLSDFTGATVNETDGVRRTWAPPDCSCRPLRVWLFGGSAAWGYFQRDAHSLASALAREAWAQGMAIEVTNHAMPGYTLGQEVRTFATVSTLQPAPDLVLFYDGFNDLALQGLRADQGHVDDESEIAVMETWVDDLFRDGITLGRPSSIEWSARPADTAATRSDVAEAPAIARHAMARYRRNAELAGWIAASIGAKVAFAFQPVLARSPAATGGPGAAEPLQVEALGRAVDTARPLLPEGTIDLTDVFGETREPVFRDMVHTNERGAQIVAARLFEELRPELEALR